MKHAYIAPINYLHMVPEEDNFHLTLAHLFKDKRYTSFYKEKKERGDFIIMDNGCFEYKKSFSKEYLLEVLEKLTFVPNVVVLPDYPFEHYKVTVDSAYESIEFFRNNYDKSVQFMYVPQSEKGDLQGWLTGYSEVQKMPEVSFVGLSILNIPVAFCEETGTEDISFNRMYATAYLQNNNLIPPNMKYHCLGLGSGVREIKYMQNFPFIYSNDSSSAIWHGINGIEFDGSSTGLFLGKTKKEVDFYIDFSNDNNQVIKDNIKFIQNLITNK